MKLNGLMVAILLIVFITKHRCRETGIGETGIGETGIGETGIGVE